MHENLELAEKPAQDELQVIDKEAEFNSAIKVLLYYQHKIEDIASVATRFIAEARNKYNHAWEQNKYFLREYAIENLKRNKDGEITGKSYKTLAAGGGIFFRQKPRVIKIDEDYLPVLKKILIDHFPDNIVNGLITEKLVYEVPDEDELVDYLEQVIQIRAEEKLIELRDANENLTEEEAKEALKELVEQGRKEMFDGEVMEVTEADPFHYMYSGSTKAFTGTALKANLTQAVTGAFRHDEEEEVDLLIESLEDNG